MNEKTVRPEIMNFDPYVPGLSIDEIRQRYGLDRVIKLASNENPLGASPLAQQAVARTAAMAFRYPQNGNPRLVEALAARLGVPADMVIAGVGSDETIDLIMRVKARPGRDNVLCYGGSFSMYRLTARLCGVEYRDVPRDQNHGLPLRALAGAADENTALVFVTTPDNPTGLAARRDQLAELAQALPRQALLVVDEAYIDFARPIEDYSCLPLVSDFGNVVVLRTFSKAYGLAGLRLGYAVMPDWLAEYIRRSRIPFSVGVVSEAAGLAALEDETFYRATLDLVWRGRDRMEQGLAALGCAVTPSQANFIMFAPPIPAATVFDELLKRGVIVRPLKSFGLPEHIRVNMGTDDENEVFLDAMKDVLGG